MVIVFLFAWIFFKDGFLQSQCIGWIPSTHHWQIAAGLFCGKPVSASPASSLFSELGIYHYFVVSGFHLNLIEKLCQRLKLNKWATVVMILYGSLCSWGPPVLRTFISLQLSSSELTYRYHFKNWHRCILSGLLCLALNPHWLHSYSLLLSWSAALILCNSLKWDRTSALTFLLLLPLISHFASANPFTTLITFIFGIAFSLFLFPASFLIFINQELYSTLWQHTLSLLDKVASLIPPFKLGESLNLQAGWFYFIALALGHHLYFVSSLREERDE